ncbi:MAG: 30S ribosome-binding factor RbfA [Terriglobia bacterium]
MTVPGRRSERVAQQIREDISALLAGGLKDPRIGFATITQVRVTADLRQAFVFVSVLGERKEKQATLEGFRAAKGYIRRELAHRLTMRRVPELSFELDETAEYSARIEELLRESKAKEEPSDE